MRSDEASNPVTRISVSMFLVSVLKSFQCGGDAMFRFPWTHSQSPFRSALQVRHVWTIVAMMDVWTIAPKMMYSKPSLLGYQRPVQLRATRAFREDQSNRTTFRSCNAARTPKLHTFGQGRRVQGVQTLGQQRCVSGKAFSWKTGVVMAVGNSVDRRMMSRNGSVLVRSAATRWTEKRLQLACYSLGFPFVL